MTYKGQIGLEQTQSRLNLMDGPEYLQMRQEYNREKLGWEGDQLAPENILHPIELEAYNAGISTDWQD